MPLDTPPWAGLVEKYGPFIGAIVAFFWKERASVAKDREKLHTTCEIVEKNTDLLDSHTVTITTHTALLEAFKHDTARIAELEARMNRMQGERDGERAAEDRHRRQKE